ncbi:MAG: DUF4199 family protein [Terrimonas sp.]|nr:DUF4199 family protein [Terrimonas sp.]
MQENKPISHLVAGSIIAGILVIYTLAINFMGQGQNQTLGYLSYGILIGGLVVFIYLYGKSQNNQVGFGGLFSYGFKATAFLTIIMIAFSIIVYYAYPEFKEKMLEVSRQRMEEDGKATDAQIDSTISMISRNYLLFAVLGTMIGMAILGAIGSLIGAAITKKNPVNPFNQQPS